MDRPLLEVADLVRAAGDAFIERSRKWITWKHVKVLLAIARCRTGALGGHLDECTRCGHRAISYNLPQPALPKVSDQGGPMMIVERLTAAEIQLRSPPAPDAVAA